MNTLVKYLNNQNTKTKEKGVKEVIDEIVNYLNNQSIKTEDRTAVWYILTALRGPDPDCPFLLKKATTEKIRGAIGLKDELGFDVSYEFDYTEKDVVSYIGKFRPQYTFSDSLMTHFSSHYEKARITIEKVYGIRLQPFGPIPI